MYAIVEIAGQQFKVAKDQKVFVHRLPGAEGDSVSFDKVLLTADGSSITLGAPAIEGAQIAAQITRHVRGDKVIVFKKKRRKGYKVKNGHRQLFTEIVINDISLSGSSKKAAPAKKANKPVEKSKPTVTETATSEKDDLKKIEGIGPKIEEIFNSAEILTFSDLADSSVEKLKEILSGAGTRYGSKNPGSWPKQARMAADGKWDELKEWQDKYKGGIEK